MEKTFRHKPVSTLAQVQVVTKLYHDCVQELKAGSSKHSKQLAKLWNLLQSTGDGITGQSACIALKNLVESGMLSVEDILHKILTLLPSAANIHWLIHLAAEMLLMEFQQGSVRCDECHKTCFTSSYSLRTSPHPFISIISTCTGAWAYVLNEIQNMLLESQSGESNPGVDGMLSPSNVIQVLYPFILYTLCNPGKDPDATFQSVSLFSALVSSMDVTAVTNHACPVKKHNLDILTMLMDAFPIMQVSSLNINLFVQLMMNILSLPIENRDFDVNKLLLNSLSVCFAVVDTPECLPVIKIFNRLLNKVDHFKCAPLLFSGVSYLICRAPLMAAAGLLKFTTSLLGHPALLSLGQFDKTFCLHVLKGSILQLLLSKNAVGHQELQLLAYKVLRALTETIGGSSVGPEDQHHDMGRNSYLLTNSWLHNIEILYDATRKCIFAQSFDQLKVVIGANYAPEIAHTAALMLCGALSLATNSIHSDSSVVDNILDMFGTVVAGCSETSMLILANLLNVLKGVRKPSVMRNIVFFLPELANSPDCIVFVLKTIQALTNVPSLYSLSTQVMCKLWKKEDRCFRYLHNMIARSRPSGSSKSQLEFNTIKCLVIKDVCLIQPHKHGSDMLKLISTALSENIHPGHVAILLDSLYLVCDSEVVNIMSAWSNLEKAVTRYHSPSATRAILKLFSLVPKFETESSEFLCFKEECLQTIWTAAEGKHAGVAGSALVCLAHYSKEDFKIRHLPQCCRPELPEPTEKSDGNDDSEFLDLPAPGASVLKMLLTLLPYMKEQAKFFLTSLLRQEVDNFPRDIRHRALNYEKKVAAPTLGLDVPSFMLKTYEKNKQPNLKPSLALGLLMCYDPKCEVDSAGKPILRSAVARMRKFLQMLQALLSEVVVDVKNWQSLIQLTRSWKMFMERCYVAVVQGRQAELDMQLAQNPADQDDLHFKKSTCHLSCRDKLTDVLKGASKGTPSMQGNAILSLVGLVHCVSEYFKKRKQEKPESLPPADSGSGFVSFEHWMSMAVDTIISVADAAYKPKGRIFSWCQFRSVSGVGSLATSQISKICAYQSFAVLAPLLLPNDLHRAGVLLNIISDFLQKAFVERAAEYADNPISLTPLGVVAGQVLSLLYRINHDKVGESTLVRKQQDCVARMTSVAFSCEDRNEDVDPSLDADKLDTTGVVLGLGFAYSAMMPSNNASTAAEAKNGLNSLLKLLENSEDESLSFQNSLCLSAVWTTVAGMQANVLESTDCTRTVNIVKDVWSQNQNNINFSQTLGFFCCCLATKSTELKQCYDELYRKWQTQLQKDKAPTRQKLACLNGLGALVGSGNITAPIACENAPSGTTKVAKLFQQMIRSSKDVAITSNAVLVLGQLYSSTKIYKTSSTGYPSSFSYLPASSILRPLFDFLRAFVHDPRKYDSVCATTVLETLCEVSSHKSTFPPVDWLPVVVPLLEHEDIQLCCVKLCLSQCSDNPQLVSLISTWLQPTATGRLTPLALNLVYESMDILIRHFPQPKVLSFLEEINDEIIQRTSVLRGLLKALKMSNLPSDIPKQLYLLTDSVYHQHSLLNDEGSLRWDAWAVIADCVSQCLNYGVITDPSSELLSDNLVVKSLLVRLLLASSGLRPLQWCGESLEACAALKSEESRSLALHILHTACVQAKRTNAITASKCTEWLQEMLGRLKELYGSAPKVTFLVKAFAVVVISWSSERNTQGNDLLVLCSETTRKFLWNNCLVLFPPCLQDLLSQPRWGDQLAGHVMSWLVHVMQENFDENSQTRTSVAQALLSLKNTKQFQKVVTWTSAVSALLL